MKMNKNKLTAVIAVATVLTLTISAFAFFTDRVETKASATTAKASDIIKVTPDPDDHPDGGDEKTILETVWDNKNPDKVVEPGDQLDLDYKLKNIGSSDIDVKETIILTSSVDLTQASPEWRLFLDSSADKYGAMIGGTVVSAEQISARQVKYTLAAFKLAKGATKSLSYKLVFDKYAGNTFQGSTCTVDYLCEMRQHVDSIGLEEQWNAIRTDSISFGGSITAVVPAA